MEFSLGVTIDDKLNFENQKAKIYKKTQWTSFCTEEDAETVTGPA